MSKSFDPVGEFNRRIPHVTSRFAFDRPWRVVGKADLQDGDLTSADSEIYSGTVITPQCFARLAFHKPTSTICLLVSKTAVNLRGARQRDGRILATYDGLAKSYLVGGRRVSDDPTEFRVTAQAMRSNLHRFCSQMDERTRKHFTLFSGSITQDSKSCEIYTNGRLAYLLDPAEKDHNIRFYAPIIRENGSFIPVQLGGRNFWDRLSMPSYNVAKLISTKKSYEESRHDLALHWQKVSSRLWDEKSLYAEEGFAFTAKKTLAAFTNATLEHRKTIAISGIVGLGVAVETHQVGLGIATFALGHVVAHSLLERGADRTQQVSELLKRAKQRQNIDAYPMDAEDVSDYFKIKTRTNIAKLCPHVDLNQINPADFEFLQADKGYLLPDHDIPEDGMRPASLRGHLLSAHQRGFSSSCSLPDSATRLDVFQSGLVRLLHDRQDGTVLVYAGYRPDACVSDVQRMPPNYIERFEDDKLVRIEYDRRHPRFSESFRSQELVTHETMMNEVGTRLAFNELSGAASPIKTKSLEAISQSFRAPDPANAKHKLYMGGQPPSLPDIAAIL